MAKVRGGKGDATRWPGVAAGADFFVRESEAFREGEQACYADTWPIWPVSKPGQFRHSFAAKDLRHSEQNTPATIRPTLKTFLCISKLTSTCDQSAPVCWRSPEARRGKESQHH